MTLKQIREMYARGRMAERAALNFIRLLGYADPFAVLYETRIGEFK